MGQYWQVINIDKFEQLGNWGKLGECLFDGTPDALVTFLNLINIPAQEVQQHPFDINPNFTGSWAGDRIVCVGDGITDTPDGMFGKEELKRFTAYTAEAADRLAEADIMDGPGSPSEHARSSDGDDNFCEHINLYNVSDQLFNDLSPQARAFFKPYLTRKNCVLRNLTKHEYVRADVIEAVCDLVEELGHVDGGVPRLGEVVLSRISWSSNTSAGMSYDITRGVWAGDRFDIQPMNTVEDEDEDDEKWKDVTDEVTEEIFAIWGSEYGDHWRNALYKWHTLQACSL